MTSLGISGVERLSAPSGGAATPAAEKIAGFALLMQGQILPQPALIRPEPTPGPVSDKGAPEDISPETAEGLMGLLEQTLTRLEAEGGPILSEQVLAAFASALGEGPVEAIGDLAAVAQLDDATLETALQERIVGFLRATPHMEPLNTTFPGEPSVGRPGAAVPRMPGAPLPREVIGDLAAVARPDDATLETTLQERIAGSLRATPHGGPSNTAFLGAPSAGRQDAGAVVPQMPGTPSPGEAAPVFSLEPAVSTAPGQASVVGSSELLGSGAQVQLPQELVRTPTPLVAPSAPAQAQASPDDQLRHHVSQQIRTADAGDSKFRFSVAPHGLGEIEIEVVRSENGRVRIAMAAESVSVLNVMRHDRDLLLDALQAKGIMTDNADLDFQTFGERDRGSGQQPETEIHPLQADAENIYAEKEPSGGSGINNGTLDILT